MARKNYSRYQNGNNVQVLPERGPGRLLIIQFIRSMIHDLLQHLNGTFLVDGSPLHFVEIKKAHTFYRTSDLNKVALDGGKSRNH